MGTSNSSGSSQEISYDDEKSLIEAAAGDPAAFSALYRTYVRSIYRYIFYRVGDAREAEDLTSQVFFEALEGLPRYRHNGHFPAWLFGIARHKIADFYRAARPELPLEAAYGQVSAGGELLPKLVRTEEARRAFELIQKLDEQDQELLRLRFIASLGFAEIAVLLHQKEDATKKRVYRLLDKLKRQLESEYD
jgi:RNA polymerase sigma-70 factor, ECF subfamily